METSADTTTCSVCGQAFNPSRPNATICSAVCRKQMRTVYARNLRERAAAKRPLVPCKHCQAPFRADDKSVYCSAECRKEAYRIERLSARATQAPCRACGKPVEMQQGRQRLHPYCNNDCRTAYRSTKEAERVAAGVARPCVVCGGPIGRHDPRAIYCSMACKDRAGDLRRQKQAPPCRQCGKELTDRRSNARFCDIRCANAWRYGQGRSTKLESRQPCKGCGAPIPDGRRTNAAYCSAECKTMARTPMAYGLTPVDVKQMLVDQDHRCLMCGTQDWGVKGFQIDHCHDSGAVRAILCTNCNTGLGHLKDDPAVILAGLAIVAPHLLADLPDELVALIPTAIRARAVVSL